MSARKQFESKPKIKSNKGEVCYPVLDRKRYGKDQVKRVFVLLKTVFSYSVVRALLLVVFIISVLPVFVFLYYRPHEQPNINYGVTFSNKYAEELGLDWKDAYIKMLDDLGVKNLRLVAYWDEVEPEKGAYDYSNIEWELNEAEKRGASVILVVGKKNLRWPECFEPQWMNDVQDPLDKRVFVSEYIRHTVNELKKYDSIKMWQVENEPFFPFGVCDDKITQDELAQEVSVVRKIDSRPILIQDSGEGGFWYPSYKVGDYLGISMYRKIWYDFWGVFLGHFVYFKYPLAYWSYRVKAGVLGVPYEKIIVTELQAEPWGPEISSKLSESEKNKSMSKADFLSTISYAQKAGFKDLYLWGVEWWLWEKEVNGNSFYWDTAKVLFR